MARNVIRTFDMKIDFISFSLTQFLHVEISNAAIMQKFKKLLGMMQSLIKKRF